MGKATKLGEIERPLTYDEIEALPFDVCLEECEGARVTCDVGFSLDELLEPDGRGLAYDIEAKVLGRQPSWVLEEVDCRPLYVDAAGRVVLRIEGTIFPV